jgi:hypothetical protein
MPDVKYNYTLIKQLQFVKKKAMLVVLKFNIRRHNNPLAARPKTRGAKFTVDVRLRGRAFLAAEAKRSQA